MRLVVARIGRAHGVRGEVSVEVRTDRPGERFVAGAVLHADGPPGTPPQLTLRGVRDHNGRLLLSFAELGDRAAAEAVRDVLLSADLPDRAEEDDAWYDHELVGLAAVDPAGAALGEVTGVRHGAQDLLVLRTPAGERLVPFVAALVPEVLVGRGRVVIDPPPGLLD